MNKEENALFIDRLETYIYATNSILREKVHKDELGDAESYKSVFDEAINNVRNVVQCLYFTVQVLQTTAEEPEMEEFCNDCLSASHLFLFEGFSRKLVELLKNDEANEDNLLKLAMVLFANVVKISVSRVCLLTELLLTMKEKAPKEFREMADKWNETFGDEKDERTESPA